MIYTCNKLLCIYKYNKLNNCMSIKQAETRKDRFKRLGAYRTNEVLKKLKVLSNCSNRSSYDYSEEDVAKIFSEIDKAVKESKSKFNFRKHKEFKL